MDDLTTIDNLTTVDEKWRGTSYDQQDMRKLNLIQVVRRYLGLPAMVAFSSILLSTWETLAATISIALGNGGTAGVFWIYLIATFALTLVYLSLSELASIRPTSGGQYYWVAAMAPHRCRKYLSYITGWLCTISWGCSIAACAFVSATMMQGLLVLNHASYNPKQWHGSLLTFAFMLVAAIVNTRLVRSLGVVSILCFILHFLGICIFVPLWVLLPRREGGSPFVESYNPAGWSSYALDTLVGASAVVTSLIGFDCSVHMSEEVKDASLSVPRSLLFGYAINALLGLFAILTFIYTVPPLDLPDTLNPSTGYLVINMFYAATNNFAATNFMTAILILIFTGGCITSLAAASRQLFAFARDGGVPFSRVVSYVPPQLGYPRNAVLLSLPYPVVIALLNIGSKLVLGIILSIFVTALISSYVISICCMLFQRFQGRVVPSPRFSLGKWGVWVNVLALVLIIPYLVFSLFPPVPNPTPATMNWAVVMVGGPILLATVYYFAWGRKRYTVPDETRQTPAADKSGDAIVDVENKLE